MTVKTKERPFGLRDKLGYLFGDFGNDFTFILSTMILSKFYTDVMGVSPGTVGTVMMAARFVDAVTDVTMGRICDRSRTTPAGKFKPWILRMCIPVAAASFLMYQSSFAGWNYNLKVAYLVVTYILWGSFFYTSINIPYGSMASAISEEPGDRQSLSTFRTMGGTLAGLVIGVCLPVFAYRKNTLPDGTVQEQLIGSNVTLIAGIFAVLSVLCYLLCYYLVTERVVVEGERGNAAKHSVAQMFKNALKNRALISIIVASVFMLLAQLTMQNMGSYIYPDYYNNAGAQGLSTIVMMIGMVIASRAERGQGIGQEALGLMQQFAFRTLGLERLELEVHMDNAAALACYRRAGFTLEGVKRHAFFTDGHFADVGVMSVLREEYEARA